MRNHPFIRSTVRAGLVSAVLLAAVAASAGPVWSAGDGFQYVGQDDKVHVLTSAPGCVAATGGGSRAVTNHTSATVTLYPRPGCAGTPVERLMPGTVTQVRPYFASVRFPVTG